MSHASITHASTRHALMIRTPTVRAVLTRVWPCALLLVSLAACDRPRPPDPEVPPEPQASQATQTADATTGSTSLPDAIHAPLDKARAVETQTLEAADRQRQAIDAATGD